MKDGCIDLDEMLSEIAELEKDYYADRPTEPYCDDDSPNDWANIAHYAEENLEKAFKRITELEEQIEKMKCCENCAFFKEKTYDICHKIKKLGTRRCAFYKMI